jgi:hypothetical protein
LHGVLHGADLGQLAVGQVDQLGATVEAVADLHSRSAISEHDVVQLREAGDIVGEHGSDAAAERLHDVQHEGRAALGSGRERSGIVHGVAAFRDRIHAPVVNPADSSE